MLLLLFDIFCSIQTTYMNVKINRSSSVPYSFPLLWDATGISTLKLVAKKIFYYYLLQAHHVSILEFFL